MPRSLCLSKMNKQTAPVTRLVFAKSIKKFYVLIYKRLSMFLTFKTCLSHSPGFQPKSLPNIQGKSDGSREPKVFSVLEDQQEGQLRLRLTLFLLWFTTKPASKYYEG